MYVLMGMYLIKEKEFFIKYGYIIKIVYYGFNERILD